MLLLFFFVLSGAASTLVFGPNFDSPKPNVLERIYSTIGSVYSVTSFEEVSARDLLRYGVVQLSSEKSLIVSDLLAEETFNPNYRPSYKFEPVDDSFDASANTYAKLADTSDKRWYYFHQFDYSQMAAKKSTSDWLPVSGCISNELSDTVSTFGEGWQVKINQAVGAGIKFTQLVGFAPGAGTAVLMGNAVGGAYSCDVGPGKKLQFQAKLEEIEISGIRQRLIKVTGDYQYSNGFLTSMEIGAWEDVDSYPQINEQNIQTACVTMPSMLMCD